MGKYSTEIFVGMDVSDKSVEIYSIPKDAEKGSSMKIKNSMESIGNLGISRKAKANGKGDPYYVTSWLPRGCLRDMPSRQRPAKSRLLDCGAKDGPYDAPDWQSSN